MHGVNYYSRLACIALLFFGFLNYHGMRCEPVILLVEDNGDDLRLLQRLFAKAGLRQPLRSVPDGVEAMSYLLGRGMYANPEHYPPPDILVIDINMPRVNGFELMSWLKTQPDFEQLIVIALSSSSEQDEINRAYQMGATSYLLKPALASELEATVNAFYQYWVRANWLPRTVSATDRPEVSTRAR
jgi:CheY-like chemotaxis protein